MGGTFLLLLYPEGGLAIPPGPDAYERRVDRVRRKEEEFPGITSLWPTSMGAPEYAPYIREVIVDKQICYGRRSERSAVVCLRRTDEEELALRRPPECPDQLACPVGGCVS